MLPLPGGDIYDDSSFTHSLRIVQHVHDRVSPWSLNEILLNYLYNPRGSQC